MSLLKPTSLERFTGISRALRLGTACLVVMLSNWLAATTALAETPGQLPPRPNILLICVDDLRPELGCYGVEYAQAPNLDRLASQGMLFTNHFVQVPSCGQSRYALLTGRSPKSSGAMAITAMYKGKSELIQTPTEAAQTLPELFRRSGYRTVCIGKVSHTPDGKVYEYNGAGDGHPEMPNAWDELATTYGPWKRGWGTFFAYTGGRHREDGQGHKDLMEFVAEHDEDLPDGRMAATAIEKLRELKARRDSAGAQPFFLGLGFFKPHMPFVATKADWDAFEGVDIPLPPQPGKPDSAYWHRSGEFRQYNAPFPVSTPLADEDIIRGRRAYLACLRYTDRQVGKVLAELDALGLADSTIVVLWGDHGWQVGDSAIWGKGCLLDRALRSSLMVRVPGVTKPGARCDAIVETLDLFPTLVELAQPSFNKTLYPLDGRSLVPLLSGEADAVRESAISYWQQGVSVRTLTHRLITVPTKDGPTKTELYDIRDSVDPFKNVADEQPDVRDALLNMIDERHAELGAQK